MRRFPVCGVTFSIALACGGDGESTTSASESGVVTATTASETSDTSDTMSAESGASETDAGETGGPVGEEYGDCQDVYDCPEGTLYACLSQVADGHVCAPSCDTHADCPPPPPGGMTTPACTTVDGRKRCIMAGCQADEDCPTGMVCHIEGPNWCHWPV